MNTLVSPPAMHVQLDGQPLDEQVLDTMESLIVRQGASVPVQAELVFCNPPQSFLDAALGINGQSLQVRIEGQEQALFLGLVTAVELKYTSYQSRYLYVRGHDRLYLLDRSRPVRAHFQMSLADLAGELAGALDIDVNVPEPGPVIPTRVQYSQSDLQLLRQEAEKAGLFFLLTGNQLAFFDLTGTDAQLQLALDRNLISAEFEINSGVACQSVEIKAWDPWLMEMREGYAIRSQEEEASIFPFGAEETRLTLPNRTAQSDEQVEMMANSLLQRRKAGEVVLRGIAEGNTNLRPGVGVEMKGVQQAVAGNYVLVTVNHIVDRKQGYVCEIDSTPPLVEPDTTTSTATAFGQVSHVADPEGLARVRVVLPAFNDFETDWLDVVLPAAGPDKGLVALPDIGDRVVLLLVNGDPAQGIVLGGVYGSQSPPDAGVQGESVERYSFLTPGGQVIRMDDGTASIRMETTDGQFMELTPEGVQIGDASGNVVEMTEQRCLIHAATQLEIEAPGNRVFIRGQAIDFERA